MQEQQTQALLLSAALAAMPSGHGDNAYVMLAYSVALVLDTFPVNCGPAPVMLSAI